MRQLVGAVARATNTVHWGVKWEPKAEGLQNREYATAAAAYCVHSQDVDWTKYMVLALIGYCGRASVLEPGQGESWNLRC